MERKVTAVYTAFSVLAFVFLASWTAYTFFQTRANNFADAASTFEDISNSTAITYSSTGRFDAPRFRSFVRSLFLEIPSLDILTISTSTGGVQYLYARHASDLVSPHVADGRWSGSIRYSQFTQRMFSGALRSRPVAGRTPFRVHAIFTILSRANFYSMGRTLLLYLLSFVILTLIVILIVPASGGRAPKPARASGPENEPERGPSSQRAHRFEESPDRGPAAEDARSDRSARRRRAREGPSPERSSVIVLGPPQESPAESNAEEAATAPPAPKNEDLRRRTATGTGPRTEETAKSTERPQAPPDGSPQEPALGGGSPQRPVERAQVAPHREVEAAGSKPSVGESSLPSGVSLPSLREVLGEDTDEHAGPDEISMYEQMAGSEPTPRPTSRTTAAARSPRSPADAAESLGAGVSDGEKQEGSLGFEITEVEEHADQSSTTGSSPDVDYRSAEDEMADIEDFEDLEQIDGSRGGEPTEPLPPRPPDRPRQASVAAPETSGTPEIEPQETQPTVPEAQEIEPPEPEPIEIDAEGPEPALEEEILLDADAITIPDVDELAEMDIDTLSEPPSDDLSGTEVEELPSVDGESASAETTTEASDSETEVLGSGGEDGAPLERSPQRAPHAEVDEQFFTSSSSRHSRELFNPESGLAWGDHLEQRLSFELDRAASFDQDLSLCVIRFAQPADNAARLNYAREIRTYFPFHDLCFEYGEDAFAVVLPNTDIDQAIRSMENFNDKMHEQHPDSPKMLFGLSARNGRLLGSERLLSESESAIQKAREDHHNSIFALRVDPGKYREFIKASLR